MFKISIILLFSLIISARQILSTYSTFPFAKINTLKFKSNPISQISNYNSTTFNDILQPFLIPRVSGSENNTKVQSFISSHFSKLNYNIQYDSFTEKTPIGDIKFTNIIATFNPLAKKKLVLACHFDSKLLPQFIGATDSALPCAILLDVANTLHPFLNSSSNPDLSLQFIFFDGEEAFVDWTSTDSLYGSRHLSKKWMQDSILSGIDLFILLDLLGTSDTTIYNYQTDNYKASTAFKRIVDVQSRLYEFKLLSQTRMNRIKADYPNGGIFYSSKSSRFETSFVDDDHRPFKEKGVDTLHVIPVPFPKVWHTTKDDKNALDMEKMSYFVIVSLADNPVYELVLNNTQEHHLYQFIAYSSLDLTTSLQTSNYLKVVDKFNDFYISAYVTHSGAKFILLHPHQNSEGIKTFFLEVQELYTKNLLNPFTIINSPITSSSFDIKVKISAKKWI